MVQSKSCTRLFLAITCLQSTLRLLHLLFTKYKHVWCARGGQSRSAASAARPASLPTPACCSDVPCTSATSCDSAAVSASLDSLELALASFSAHPALDYCQISQLCLNSVIYEICIDFWCFCRVVVLTQEIACDDVFTWFSEKFSKYWKVASSLFLREYIFHFLQ